MQRLRFSQLATRYSQLDYPIIIDIYGNVRKTKNLLNPLLTTYTRMGIIQVWKVERESKCSLSIENVNLFPLGGLYHA